MRARAVRGGKVARDGSLRTLHGMLLGDATGYLWRDCYEANFLDNSIQPYSTYIIMVIHASR